MNPVSWTWKRGFYMSKLSYEDKINIYNNKKEGMSIKVLSKKYDVRDNVIKYLVRVIDKHGYEVLRTNKNNYYSPNQKEQIINRVLIDGESIFSVAVDEGLSSDGLLRNWISKYKENGYNIVERKQEVIIEESLKKKLELICEFSNTTLKIINGSIRKIDRTNLTYVEPHRIIINNTTFLAFNYSNEIFIENLSNKIKLSEIEDYLKTN